MRGLRRLRAIGARHSSGLDTDVGPPLEGGPFHALCRALGLVRGEAMDLVRLSLASLALTWVPLVLLASFDWLIRGRSDGLLRDLTVEVRPWVVLPLLFVAGRWVNVEVAHGVERFVGDGLAAED